MSPQRLSCKTWQYKTCAVNVVVVVSAKLFLFLHPPATQWDFNISLGIFTADHESDLSRRICWDGRVCVLHGREDFLALLLQLRNQREVEPWVFSCSATISHRGYPLGRQSHMLNAHERGK